MKQGSAGALGAPLPPTAPHVDINMNPLPSGQDPATVAKDALYFSPHKFIGGVDSPGVLVAKKRLFQNSTPCTVGGGTVFFVRLCNAPSPNPCHCRLSPSPGITLSSALPTGGGVPRGGRHTKYCGLHPCGAGHAAEAGSGSEDHSAEGGDAHPVSCH